MKGAYTISDGQYTLREGTKRPWIPFVAGSQYTTEDITYSISDKNVVSIEDGNLIAKEVGKTVVTLSLPNGIKREINVVVEEKKNTSISQKESTEPFTDTKSGKFKAKKSGTVTVTAKCNGVKKSCVVKVKR